MQRDKVQRTCTLRGSVMEMTESDTKTNTGQTATDSNTAKARVSDATRSMDHNKRKVIYLCIDIDAIISYN